MILFERKQVRVAISDSKKYIAVYLVLRNSKYIKGCAIFATPYINDEILLNESKFGIVATL